MPFQKGNTLGIKFRYKKGCTHCLGKHHSEETILKISESKKGQPSPMKGKILSDESKLKMSEAHKGNVSSKGTTRTDESKLKMSLAHRREKCSNWKGGRLKTPKGYMVVLTPEHPHAPKSGYVFEHRLIMEQKLGRYLTKNEVVHHLNGVKDDNREENLMLLTIGVHNNTYILQPYKDRILELEVLLSANSGTNIQIA